MKTRECILTLMGENAQFNNNECWLSFFFDSPRNSCLCAAMKFIDSVFKGFEKNCKNLLPCAEDNADDY